MNTLGDILRIVKRNGARELLKKSVEDRVMNFIWFSIPDTTMYSVRDCSWNSLRNSSYKVDTSVLNLAFDGVSS